MVKTLDLSPFYGTENYYRHWLGGLIYTDGVKYVADNAGNGAYWLIDAIASYQGKCKLDPMLRDFQIWFLKLNGKGGAVLECWRDTGDGEEAVIRQKIEHTDFPEDIKLYVENNTLCLPSER